jgi:L-amino acid N-acyltransferase YncA
VNLRDLVPADLDAVGPLLHDVFRRAALEHGAPPPWRDAAEARALAELYLDGDAVVAESGGAIIGCGFARRRGEIATIGPIAAAVPGRGTGGKILDELIARAEHSGVAAMRLYQDGWNPGSFALYAGRSFAAVDTIAQLERPEGPPPRLDSSRGLDVQPFARGDLAEVVALDRRLTGLDRPADLEKLLFVARRRGAIAGYLGASGERLGPALALDVADLGALVARALKDRPGRAQARLSTAAPTAMLAALGLGFRVTSIGTLMVRGVLPPARPPQIYGSVPEIL